MDEQHFDNMVKARLDEFSIDFDPAAMAQFHQLQDEAAVLPWWKRSLPWLKWGLLLLILLINLGLLMAYILERQSVALLEHQVASLQEDRNVRNQFKIIHRVDTLYIEREAQNTAYNGVASYTGIAPNASPSQGKWRFSSRSGSSPTSSFIPANPQTQSSRAGFLGSGKASSKRAVPAFGGQNKGEESSLLANPGTIANAQKELERLASPEALPLYWDLPLFSQSAGNHRLEDNPYEIPEKIGTPLALQTGLSLQFFLPQVDEGQGLLSWVAGLHTELFINQHWRLLTGFNISRPRYNADLPLLDSGTISEETELRYPGWASVPGMPAEVEVRSNVLDVPLHLEYAFGLGYNSRLVAGAGWSPRLYMYQYFNYPYDNNGNQANSSVEINKGIGWFSGTADATLGMEFLLPKNWRWRTGLYYRQGLQPMGLEKTNYQIFGIRSGLWFGW